MSTFLVFSITSRKEIEMREVDVVVLPGEEVNIEKLISIADPPFNGKSIVVDKKYARTFRLNCSIVETNR